MSLIDYEFATKFVDFKMGYISRNLRWTNPKANYIRQHLLIEPHDDELEKLFDFTSLFPYVHDRRQTAPEPKSRRPGKLRRKHGDFEEKDEES